MSYLHAAAQSSARELCESDICCSTHLSALILMKSTHRRRQSVFTSRGLCFGERQVECSTRSTSSTIVEARASVVFLPQVRRLLRASLDLFPRRRLGSLKLLPFELRGAYVSSIELSEFYGEIFLLQQIVYPLICCVRLSRRHLLHVKMSVSATAA